MNNCGRDVIWLFFGIVLFLVTGITVWVIYMTIRWTVWAPFSLFLAHKGYIHRWGEAAHMIAVFTSLGITVLAVGYGIIPVKDGWSWEVAGITAGAYVAVGAAYLAVYKSLYGDTPF